MSRKHARMRARLGRAGLVGEKVHPFRNAWWRMMQRFGSRRRARKAHAMLAKRNHEVFVRTHLLSAVPS